MEASLPPTKAQLADCIQTLFVSFVLLLFLKVGEYQSRQITADKGESCGFVAVLKATFAACSWVFQKSTNPARAIHCD